MRHQGREKSTRRVRYSNLCSHQPALLRRGTTTTSNKVQSAKVALDCNSVGGGRKKKQGAQLLLTTTHKAEAIDDILSLGGISRRQSKTYSVGSKD